MIELDPFIIIVPEYWTKNYTHNGFLLEKSNRFKDSFI